MVDEEVDSDALRRVAERRSTMLAMVESLTRRLHGIRESATWTASDDEHDPEGVTVAFERAQVSGLLDLARDELRELDAAEARILAGTYGRCQVCGRPIGDERLAALPAVTTCITCTDRRRG
jgi:DnaK suppressor protein